MIPEDNLEANIIAWTAKEALYKAAMTEGLDLRSDISIIALPQIDRKMNLPGAPAPILGKGIVKVNDTEQEMQLYSYDSDGYCITLAFSPKCAKFGKK